jgi:Ca-activated chloride channel homolog
MKNSSSSSSFHQFKQVSKPLLFGACGAIGCLAAALLGELLLFFTLPADVMLANVPQVDIVFVLDVTSSMNSEIKGVQQGIQDFVKELEKQKLNSRVGLIAFRDRWEKEKPEVLIFDNSPFTTNNRLFSEQVGNLRAEGGGDPAESSLDALTLAARQSFRPDATKVILLITDAPPKLPDVENVSVAAAAQALESRSIDQLHLVINARDQGIYTLLQSAVPGEVFLLNDAATGRSGFDRILPKIGGKIAEITVRGIQSNREFAQDSLGRVMAMTAAWTSFLAVGVALALIIGQNRYLRRRLITFAEMGKGSINGVVAGVSAGLVGQAVFILLGSFPLLVVVGRVLSWGLLGGLVGLGIALFVPNLQRRRGVLGGLVGGVLGSIVFLVGGVFLGEVAGRLIGSATLGFFIGVAIAWVEVLNRQAWLVVRWPNNEQREIPLGREPIRLGSADSAHIYLPKNKFPPKTAEIYYESESDQIILKFDPMMKEKGMKILEQSMMPGSQRLIAGIAIEVKSTLLPEMIS